MDPDKFQQAWRTQSSETRVTVDADSLLDALQLDLQIIRVVILFNDLGSIGIPLLVLPVWIYMGIAIAPPWTWYLMVPADLWLIGFTLVVRPPRKSALNDPVEPLLSSAQESLALVEQQIWLQRNILWWYILPILIPILAFTTHLAWLHASGWLDDLSVANYFMFVLTVAMSCIIWYGSQRVIRTQYEPRRQELLALLTSLNDETTREVHGEYPVLMRAKQIKYSRRRMVIASLCIVAILLIVLAGIVLKVRHNHPSGHDHSDATRPSP